MTTQVPHAYAAEAAERGISVHELLTEKAEQQAIGEHGLVALDWHSGNRSVLVNHELSGLVVGQTLATRPEDHYRALLESTAFGTRMIVETFQEAGVPVTELVVAGGLLKNALLMQIYADVLDLPLSTIDSQQGPALGSAIHAAVAAGAYPDVATAARAMGRVNRGVHQPDRGQRGGVRRAVRRVPRAPRPLRPRRQRRHAAPQGDPPQGGARHDEDDAQHDRRPARAGGRAALRADPQQPRRVDRRQRLGPRARRGPARDQAERRVLRRALRRRDGRLRPRRQPRRGRPPARAATPPRTPTSTGTCRRSAAWCTPTRRTPPPGPPAARPSRAC